MATLTKENSDFLSQFDIVIVGSGNSACAYISEVLSLRPDLKICVIERGENPNSYLEKGILNRDQWPRYIYDHEDYVQKVKSNYNIRAASIGGGGGTVNYMMCHEKDERLDVNLGSPPVGCKSWTEAKQAVDSWLGVETAPNQDPSPNVQKVFSQLEWEIDTASSGETFVPTYETTSAVSFRQVQTVYDKAGNRRHNGWIATNWENVTLITETEVTSLSIITPDDRENLDKDCVTGISVLNGKTKERHHWKISEHQRFILAAQQSSVRLLLPHKENFSSNTVRNNLGEEVEDHVVKPLFTSKAYHHTEDSVTYSPYFYHTETDNNIQVFEWSLQTIISSSVTWATYLTLYWLVPLLKCIFFCAETRHVFALHVSIVKGNYQNGKIVLGKPNKTAQEEIQKYRKWCREKAKLTWWSSIAIFFLDFEQNTQFHTCGGCQKGTVVDDRYQLINTQNVFVIDTSTCHLTACSPQMTAYLIGFNAARAHYFESSGSV